jgi:hypothetical protein
LIGNQYELETVHIQIEGTPYSLGKLIDWKLDQEKMLTGKVSTLLNQAAEKIANNPKGSAKIIKEVYEQVLDELQKTYRFGKKPSS